MRQFELRPFRQDAAKFLSKRKFTGIKEKIYGDQGRILRGSRRKFMGIKEEFYGDQRENLQGSKKNFRVGNPDPAQIGLSRPFRGEAFPFGRGSTSSGLSREVLPRTISRR
jgi:hypothetical protein